MSEHVGFLAVDQNTGYVVEGKDHAAKIFDTMLVAQRACPSLSRSRWIAMRLPYGQFCQSLLKGSAFCFDSEVTYGKFLRRLHNDPANKPFLALSRDRNFIRWRISDERLIPESVPDNHFGPSVAAHPVSRTATAPPQPPVEAFQFNPEVLVRERNPDGR